MAIAEARSRAAKQSPTEPPPMAMGALPVKPAVISLKTSSRKASNKGNAHKKRSPINDDVVGAKAQPRLNPVEKRLQIWSTYAHEMRKDVRVKAKTITHVRPYISDSGARNRGFGEFNKKSG